MNDLIEPVADESPVPDVNPGALRRRPPVPDVDPGALTRPPVLPPPASRRHLLVVAAAVVVAVALTAGGVWWRREATADPQLAFVGRVRVYRDPGLTDRTGIVPRGPVRPDEPRRVEVTPRSNGRLFAVVRLRNGGDRDVRIKAVRRMTSIYWAFEGMSLAAGRSGERPGEWEPFRPFTLRPGQSRSVRLELRLGDCDPPPDHPVFTWLDSVPVRYRMFGLTRTGDVPFEQEEIVMPAGRSCRDTIFG